MANKCVMYTALVVVCLGIGALIAGLAVYYGTPEKGAQLIELYTADCELFSHNNSDPTISGVLSLTQQTNGDLVISGNVIGIPPGPHGFHIHAYGVKGYDCTSAGGHYNPKEVDHAGPNNATRHAGDLGNINVSSAAGYNLRIEDDGALLYGVDSIVGRGIVIHEGEDDLVSQPTGNAGGRLACCTIMHRPLE